MRNLKLLTAALAATMLPTLAPAQPAARPELQGAALVHALQHGGYVLIMRHAHAPNGAAGGLRRRPGQPKP